MFIIMRKKLLQKRLNFLMTKLSQFKSLAESELNCAFAISQEVNYHQNLACLGSIASKCWLNCYLSDKSEKCDIHLEKSSLYKEQASGIKSKIAIVQNQLDSI